MGFRIRMRSSLGFAITGSDRGLVFSFSLPRDPDYSPNGLKSLNPDQRISAKHMVLFC